jgi:hypothetical protein
MKYTNLSHTIKKKLSCKDKITAEGYITIAGFHYPLTDAAELTE